MLMYLAPNSRGEKKNQGIVLNVCSTLAIAKSICLLSRVQICPSSVPTSGCVQARHTPFPKERILAEMRAAALLEWRDDTITDLTTVKPLRLERF